MSAAPVEVKIAPVAKSVKKPSTPKAKSDHPTFAVMITEAIKQLNERSGSSKQAISKFIASNYSVDMTNNLKAKHFRVALVSGSNSGFFKQVKGTGATGSFKVGEATKSADKVEAKKVKEAAKPKKIVPKVDKKPVIKETKKVVVKVKVAKQTVDSTPKPKKNVRKPVAVKVAVKKAIAKATTVEKAPSAKKVVSKKPVASKKA